MTGVLELQIDGDEVRYCLEGRPLAEGAALELLLPTGDWLWGQVHLSPQGPPPLRPGFRFHRGVGCDLGPRAVTMLLGPGWIARWAEQHRRDC